MASSVLHILVGGSFGDGVIDFQRGNLDSSQLSLRIVGCRCDCRELGRCLSGCRSVCGSHRAIGTATTVNRRETISSNRNTAAGDSIGQTAGTDSDIIASVDSAQVNEFFRPVRQIRFRRSKSGRRVCRILAVIRRAVCGWDFKFYRRDRAEVAFLGSFNGVTHGVGGKCRQRCGHYCRDHKRSNAFLHEKSPFSVKMVVRCGGA